MKNATKRAKVADRSLKIGVSIEISRLYPGLEMSTPSSDASAIQGKAV